MPNFSSRTLATGARQFVVHEALEIIECFSGIYSSLLTPIHMVMSSSFAGAEMMTFFAPAFKWSSALSRVLKRPVHSSTTSMPRSFQGRLPGSLSASTFISLPFTTMAFSPALTSAFIIPSTESYFKRWVRVFGSVISFMATNSMSLSLSDALSTFLPILPKPFMATLTAMYFLLEVF